MSCKKQSLSKLLSYQTKCWRSSGKDQKWKKIQTGIEGECKESRIEMTMKRRKGIVFLVHPKFQFLFSFSASSFDRSRKEREHVLNCTIFADKSVPLLPSHPTATAYLPSLVPVHVANTVLVTQRTVKKEGLDSVD